MKKPPIHIHEIHCTCREVAKLQLKRRRIAGKLVVLDGRK